MSYQRVIQPLIIEDEHTAKEYYETVFDHLGTTYQILPPRFAFCHADAMEVLSQERPYHLVVLDLRLPENPGQPPASSLDLGLDVLSKALDREPFPVPALLVISGNLQHANQQDLMKQVQDGFSYGRVLVKSEKLEREIEEAIKHCQSYCDVGLHMRDSGDRVFPTLSPRDDDLLRRCALAIGSLALDLEWWSAELSPPDLWTKVLLGRFALDDGRGHSLYSFFKLSGSDGAASVFREAEILGQKLKHVKVLHAGATGSRSLLVTQTAGSNDERPLTLDNVMVMPHGSVGDALKAAAESVAGQVAALGERTPDQLQLSAMLWKYHKVQRLQDQWEKRGGNEILADLKEAGIDCPHPVGVFTNLRSSRKVVRYQKQEFRHGDLNYTNIALEKSALESFHAYIFDASGCTPGTSTRDLAMLEVTTLLHQPSVSGSSIVTRSMALYATPENGHIDDNTGDDNQVANVVSFVRSIREQAVLLDSKEIYALLVFDNAMMQLGGLGFGSSFNKIRDPRDAVYLAALSARWLTTLAPFFFEA